MEKEKKSGNRRRFNVLDAILVLLAILCIVGVWQRKNLQNLFSSGETLDAYTVTFEIRDLRSATVDLLTKDTVFYLAEESESVTLGVLRENVAASPAAIYLQVRETVENTQGNVIAGPGEMVEAIYYPDGTDDRSDVRGTLSCRGIVNEGVLLVEGKIYLALNQTLRIQTEKADLEIHITGIERVE